MNALPRLHEMPAVGDTLIRIHMPTYQFPLFSEAKVTHVTYDSFRVQNIDGQSMGYGSNGFARWGLKRVFSSNEEALHLLRKEG